MHMKKGEASKARLVAGAAELFWRQGYNATGLSEILQAAHLPKGCLYFYFEGKWDLAAAVIEYYQRIVSDDMKRLAEGRDWREFVHALTQKHITSAAEGEHNGCPFAVISRTAGRASLLTRRFALRWTSWLPARAMDRFRK